MVCSRVAISGVVGGSWSPYWNTKGLVINYVRPSSQRVVKCLSRVATLDLAANPCILYAPINLWYIGLGIYMTSQTKH